MKEIDLYLLDLRISSIDKKSLRRTVVGCEKVLLERLDEDDNNSINNKNKNKKNRNKNKKNRNKDPTKNTSRTSHPSKDA